MDISEFKMGSIIYTYQRSKRKPIPLTEERIQTLRDHEKFLKRHRVGESRIVSEEVITPDCRSGDHGFESRTGCQVGYIRKILWVTHSGWPSGVFRRVSFTASGTSPSVICNSHERSRSTDTVDGCNRSS